MRPWTGRCHAGSVFHLAVIGLLATAVFAQNGDGAAAEEMAALRAEFAAAIEDPVRTEELATRISGAYPDGWRAQPPLVAAYAASVVGLQAKFAANLVYKLDRIRTATTMFDEIVASNPDDVEIIFLRYSFNGQLPAVFGRRRIVRADLERVLGMLATSGTVPEGEAGTSAEVRRSIILRLLDTDAPSREDRDLLRRLLRDPDG